MYVNCNQDSLYVSVGNEFFPFLQKIEAEGKPHNIFVFLSEIPLQYAPESATYLNKLRKFNLFQYIGALFLRPPVLITNYITRTIRSK